MKPAGKRRFRPLGALISLIIIAAAIGFADYAWRRSSLMPTSDDASIDADVVHVAAAVGGRIIDIPVAENSRVAKDDLLFQIDPVPYRLAVEQAEADLALAEAALGTQQRLVSTQRSAAAVAADQIKRATANLDLATRTVERLRPLAAKGFVPTQQLDTAETAERDAATSLEQARVQEVSAVRAIDTTEGAEATVRARKAALAIAKRALEDTTVRAAHPGRVVGLAVRTGEMIAPSQTLVHAGHRRRMVRRRQFSRDAARRHQGRRLRDRLLHDRPDPADQGRRPGHRRRRGRHRTRQSSALGPLRGAIAQLGQSLAALSCPRSSRGSRLRT